MKLPAAPSETRVEGPSQGRSSTELDRTAALLRGAVAEAEDLRTRLQVAEGRLRVIESSAGWRVILRYRRWLRRTVWSLPGFARIYETIAGAAVRALSGHDFSGDLDDEIPNAAILKEALSSGDVIVCCDWPPGAETARAMGMLKVHGWAACGLGIESVKVSIDSRRPVDIEYGLSRPDVGGLLVDYPDARHCGFAGVCAIDDLSVGLHRLEVKAIARSGASARVVRTFQVDGRDPYQVWIAACERGIVRSEPPRSFNYAPLVSLVTPVYKTPLVHLKRCIDSVVAQTYSRWELILIDDGSGDSALRETLARRASDEQRIKVLSLETNSGIAAATNAGIDAAVGDYVGFLDHDDELAPVALQEVVAALNCESRPDVLYSDEDKITEDGVRFEPFFKPSFSLDLLRSFNYLCHFLLIRRGLFDEVGGIRSGFEGSQDHDLVLRLSERTRRFHRIPQVLYHWRAVAGSTALDARAKPDAAEAAIRALEEHLARSGAPGEVEQAAPKCFRVRYRLDEEPEILIIMPTGGNMPRLTAAVESVLAETEYSNFRLAVADNSRDDQVRGFLRDYAGDRRVTVVDFRGELFNFSHICNRATADDAARFSFS